MSERTRALRIRPHRRSYESLRACLASLYWAWIRGVETETCQRCGSPNSLRMETWWHADDEDWISVSRGIRTPNVPNGTDTGSGAICMRCFTVAWKAAHPGQRMFWKATPDA